MNSKKDSISYALGLLLQANLKSQGFTDLNLDKVAEAMKDAAANTSKMDIANANSIIQAYQQEKSASQFAAIKQEGADFLAANAKKEGVVSLASGLQYKVLRSADGLKPKASNTVEVHYEGRLLNGKVFDSSYKRGQTIQFGLTQVIRGWTEGLQQMPVGSKYELYIPYNLAYGERGAGQDIPPYAALIFVVELISFK